VCSIGKSLKLFYFHIPGVGITASWRAESAALVAESAAWRAGAAALQAVACQ
jgi:hypothetical protein